MTPLIVGQLSAPELRAPDRQPPTIRSARCAGVPAMAESIAGTVIITIVAGWVGGYALALVLLNRAVLSMLGIAP